MLSLFLLARVNLNHTVKCDHIRSSKQNKQRAGTYVSGVDGIPPTILKENIKQIGLLLAYVFNMSCIGTKFLKSGKKPTSFLY